MKVLTIYLRLYGRCLRDALTAIAGANLWTVLLPIAMSVTWNFLGALLAPLGILGGLLLGFVQAALFSLYLSILSDLIDKSRVSLAGFKQHVFRYLWSVVNVLFVFWIADWVLDLAMGNNPRAASMKLVLYLVAFVALNTTPETIYERGTYGGLETLGSALQFLQENWIEWLVPNVALGVGLYFGAGALERVLPFALAPLLVTVLVGAVVHVVFVFRGFLFRVLAGTSHRQRMFAFRNR